VNNSRAQNHVYRARSSKGELLFLCIRGKHIVGFDGEEHRLLKDGIVVIEENRFKHIGKIFSDQVDRWIEARQSLVIPGLINTHTRLKFTGG